MVANTKDASASVSPDANSDDGDWLDVKEELQLSFENVGERFTGKFLGWSETKTGIAQAHFQAENGDWFTNVGESLKRQLKQIQIGQLVRITYTGDLDVGQASPMKQFRVQYKNR